MSKVVLLTGPAGTGKSQTSAAWAERGTTPRAVMDADFIEGIGPEHRPFVIDNSELTLDETVGQVDAIVARQSDDPSQKLVKARPPTAARPVETR